MIDIFCGGVKITPMGEGLTLSLNGGIFADLVRSYSTSFDVVRTPDVNEALGLTGAIYNFLQGQLKAVQCDVCINGHNQYGTLQVESLTPTTASLTLYVVVIGLEESVLEMTLPEMCHAAHLGGVVPTPFGIYNQPSGANAVPLNDGRGRFSHYQSGFQDNSDETLWRWEMPVVAVNDLLSYINILAPGLDLSPIASAMAGVNVLANSFYIPFEAPAVGYFEFDGHARRIGFQKSVHFDVAAGIVTVFDFTAKYSNSYAIEINYYYEHTDSTTRYIVTQVNGTTVSTDVLVDTPNPSSQTITPTTISLNAGDVVSVLMPADISNHKIAAHIRVYGGTPYPNINEADRHLEYEGIVNPLNAAMISYLVPTLRPAFSYVTYRSSLPKITVRDFLSVLLKLCGLSATVSIETTEIDGTIDAMHPDNDINGTGGCSLIMADGTLVYNVEPTSEGGSKNEIEIALWQAVGLPDTAAGNMLTAVVQNFEHSYGTPDQPTTYIDSTKSREGAMVLLEDATYSGNSVQIPYDAKGALYANFGQYLDDVRLKPTADITAWRLREWMLFPDIIYINGWRVYITESSIDTDTGFYTFKGILTE